MGTPSPWGIGVQGSQANVGTCLIHDHQLVGIDLFHLVSPSTACGLVALSGSKPSFFR